MTAEQDAFGRRMKEERERRGITLDAIVASTKISRSLLEALERNDFSRWPGGIFRRSYMRDYAGALGLEPEPIVAEFTRIFPEENATPSPFESPLSTHQSSPLRLTLAADDNLLSTKTAWRVAAAADTCAVVAVAGLVALVSEVGIGTAVGAVALVYFAASTAWKGRSFAAWWLGGDASMTRPPAHAHRPARLTPARSCDADAGARWFFQHGLSATIRVPPLRLVPHHETPRSSVR